MVFIDQLKPGALKGTNSRKCLSYRSCSEERLPRILLTGFGFVSCLNKGIAFCVILNIMYSYFLHSSGFCCVRMSTVYAITFQHIGN